MVNVFSRVLKIISIEPDILGPEFVGSRIKLSGWKNRNFGSDQDKIHDQLGWSDSWMPATIKSHYLFVPRLLKYQSILNKCLVYSLTFYWGNGN